ncbi:helix-turn-helix transcriptional regulator [Kitasatospora sp. NPDC051170]|uniref:helix-turn-helix transcriptional regulator n=1 Tax=Kitasatospora sp. NPDC051170 TaxID=3364056 RepID=UPI0037913721
MIRRADEGWYRLTLLPSSGGQVLRNARGHVETFDAWDLCLIESQHPYEEGTSGRPTSGVGSPPGGGVGIDLPASLLSVPPHGLRGLLGRRLPGREGAGALLAEFVINLDRQAAVLQRGEASRLGAVVVELVSVWISGELDAEGELQQEHRPSVRTESIRAFIRGALHDPGLSPSVVAAAHHISVSHLHRLFARHFEGETVAAFIRRQRLVRAERELADPALIALPIRAIGARCGMPSASEFGRVFRAAYGLTPREHRRRAQLGLGEEAVRVTAE